MQKSVSEAWMGNYPQHMLFLIASKETAISGNSAQLLYSSAFFHHVSLSRSHNSTDFIRLLDLLMALIHPLPPYYGF